MRPISTLMLTRGFRLTMALSFACAAVALATEWISVPGVEFTSPSLVTSADVAGLTALSNKPQTTVTQATRAISRTGRRSAAHPVTPPSGHPLHAERLLSAMNTARLAAGTHPLVRDRALDAVALSRAQDLLRLDYFEHYGPDGESAFSELRARGIAYRIAGENLARNGRPAGRTAYAAFESLMASEGHRANIVEPRFSKVGIAAVRSGELWLYVTVFTN